MDVRRARRADALAIATVHVRSWQAAYRGLLPQSYLDELHPLRGLAQWETILEVTGWPSTGTLVLIDTSTSASTTASAVSGPGTSGASHDVTESIAGFAHISPTRDDDDDPASVGELQTFYIDPARWRRRGGSTLLTAAQDQFLGAGFRSASAWVLETNAVARAFYERHGWSFDGTTKPHDWGTFVVTDVRYRVPLA